MLYATTSTLQGREIESYLGVVFGDAVLGVNVFKDLMGAVRDVIGGRSATYERELGAARDTALANMTQQAMQLGADAVIGIDIDYETVGSNGSMLMVAASGTAVRLKGGGAARPGASPWSQPGG